MKIRGSTWVPIVPLRRELLGCRQSQELSQWAVLAPDWLNKSERPIRSWLCSLTPLLIMTTTQKFPSRDPSLTPYLVMRSSRSVRVISSAVILLTVSGLRCKAFSHSTRASSASTSTKYLLSYLCCRTIRYLSTYHIWRGKPGDEADVPATKLPLTNRISTLSFPLQSCRSRYNCVVIFLKGPFLHPRATALQRGREFRNPVRGRQPCSRNVAYVGVPVPYRCISKKGSIYNLS